MTHRRYKLFWHLFPINLAVTILAIAAVTYHSTTSLKTVYFDNLEKSLETTARLVDKEVYREANLADDFESKLRDLSVVTGLRITIIAPDGTVLGDSFNNPKSMDNHIGRKEIRESLDGDVGRSVRYSITEKDTLMYVSIPILSGGKVVGVIRTATPVSQIYMELGRIYLRVAVGGALVVLLAGIASAFLIKKTTHSLELMRVGAERIAKGEFSKKIPVPEPEELAMLAVTLNNTAKELGSKIVAMERQRCEIEAVLESMCEGVFATDTVETVIGINRSACEFFDVTSQFAKGKTIQEVIRNTDIQNFVQMVIKTGKTLSSEVTVIDTVEQFLDIHGMPLLDSQNETIGALFVMHDISKIKKLEKIRKDFVANVSHELRTPITTIKGFVETLEDGVLEDTKTALEFLAIIHRQTDRMHAIIEDLLELARIEQATDRKVVTMSESNLRLIMESAIETCRQKAIEKNIEITIEASDEIVAHVSNDLIELAIVNLIDNAIKYSDQDSSIKLTLTRDIDFASIHVIDNGFGIPREHLSRIFERFYRVEVSRSREAGGTGLGLSIVKHIALMHEGKVVVDSIPGSGSTFTLILPLEKLREKSETESA